MKPSGYSRVFCSRLLVFGALLALELAAPDRARAFACVWDGSSSTAWSTAANWSSCNSTTPQSGDTVSVSKPPANQPIIAAATNVTISGLTIDTGASVTVNGHLTLTGNSGGAGDLNVGATGTLTWTGGTMSGSGNTTIAAGGTLDLSNGTRILDTRTLTNNGDTIHSGAGYFYLANGAVFNNTATGSYDAQNDYGIYPSGAAGSFLNAGTFTRTTSSGLYTINVPITNSGTFSATSGSVTLSGSGTQTHTGSFNSTGATLRFSAGNHALNGGVVGTNVIFDGGQININSSYNVTGTTTVSGANPVTFNAASTVTSLGSSLVVSNGTVNFNSGAAIGVGTVNLTGGTLAGSDIINVSGLFTFNGGTLGGTGAFNANGDIDMSAGTRIIDTRTLHNAGTATFSGAGYLYLANGGIFDNKAGATFDAQNDYGIYPSGTPGNFLNAGTFTRSTSSGLFTINTPITNSGSVAVTSGTLTLSGTGTQTHTGSFNSTGATLKFSAGNHTLNGALSGTNVIFEGGQVNVNSTYNLTGTTSVTGSNPVSFNGSSTVTSIGSSLVVSGGTVNFNSGSLINPSTLTMTGGTLSGADTVTVPGLFTFNGGTVSGSGPINANGGIEMSSGTRVVDTRTLHNSGTATFSGAGYLYLSNNAVWDNKASAIFDAQNDYGIYPSGSPGGTFNNLGTFQRTTSGGTFTVNTPFNNSGTVDIQSGKLTFSGAFVQTAGGTHLNGGNLGGNFSPPLAVQGGVLDGNGTIDGNVSVSNTGQFSPGNSPGEMSLINSHTYAQASPAVYNVDIDGTSPGVDYDRVLISGAATLGGELKVTLGYSPALGDSFTILTHASRTGTFSKLTFPSAGAGLGWDIGYTNTETTLTIQNLLPFAPMKVDAHAGTGTVSDGNGVLEPGERVVVEPNWQNMTESDIASTGTASNASGPGGATYSLPDTSADYGAVTANSSKDCFTATANCYQFQVSDPAVRPTTHWDASFKETLTGGTTKTWMLHVGDSFVDVPRSQTFYSKIETMLHTGITGGCDATHYCPGDPVNRGQMAIFIAKAVAGGGPNVPASGVVSGKPYNCVAGGTSIFTDVAPTALYCKHVHYIAVQNVTLGCSLTQFCPNTNVKRIDMAAFIAKAVVAPGGGAAVPTVYGPDPITGFSYNCNFGGNVHFTDVPAGSTFCKHVHYLWARGFIGGTGPITYSPDDPVKRDAMAKFLSNAFNLLLYGPVP